MADFKDEAELTAWVQSHSNKFFNETSIWIPRQHRMYPGAATKGAHRRPDAFVIDYTARRWHIIEIELASHGLWRHQRDGILRPGHITDQLSVFAAGIRSPVTISRLAKRFAAYIRDRDLYCRAGNIRYLAEAMGQPLDEYLLKKTTYIVEGCRPAIAVFIDKLDATLLDNFSLFAQSLNCSVDLYRVGKSSNGTISSPDIYQPFRSFGPEQINTSHSIPLRYLEDTGRTIQEFTLLSVDGSVFWNDNGNEYLHFIEAPLNTTSPTHTFRIHPSLFDELRSSIRKRLGDAGEWEETVVLLLEQHRWVAFEFEKLIRIVHSVDARRIGSAYEFHIDESAHRLLGRRWENSADVSGNFG